MRWCTYSTDDRAPRVGLVVDGYIRGLDPSRSMIGIIASATQLAAAYEQASRSPAEVVALARATLHAPVPVPPSIRDFMAFEEHVVTSSRALGREVHPDWYQIPVFYFSNPAGVRGPTDNVEISPLSVAFDFELEIAAVIGT